MVVVLAGTKTLKIQESSPRLGSTRSNILGKRAPFYFLLFASLNLITTVKSSRQHLHQRNAFNADIMNDVRLLDLLKRSGTKNWEEIDPSCEIYRYEALHAVMDRVCVLCHEMFSHEQNSLRAECRKNCFRNRKFRACLEIFSPLANQTEMA